METGTNLC